MKRLLAPNGYPWPGIPAAELLLSEDRLHFLMNPPDYDTIKFGYGQEEGVGFTDHTPADVFEAILRMEIKPSLPVPEKKSVTLMLRAACTGLLSESHTVSRDTPLHVGSTVFGSSGNPYEIRTVAPLSEISWNLVAGGICRFPPGKEGWWPVSWFLLRRELFMPAPNEEWSFFLSRVTQEKDELPGPVLVRNVRFEWAPRGYAERPSV